MYGLYIHENVDIYGQHLKENIFMKVLRVYLIQ